MITQEESEEIETILNLASEYSKNLSQWEQEFIDSIRTRYEKYGTQLYVSEKQYNVLKKIQTKCEEASNK